MSLTSGWTTAFVALLAVGVTVATTVTWDIPRWRRTRRSVLLICVQILTMATLGTVINAAGGFYGSLADLVGGPHPPGAVIKAGTNDQTGAAMARLPAWLAAARKSTGSGRGVWTQMRIDGRRTGYSLPAWVYVPDAYFDTRQPTRQFPVRQPCDG